MLTPMFDFKSSFVSSIGVFSNLTVTVGVPINSTTKFAWIASDFAVPFIFNVTLLLLHILLLLVQLQAILFHL